MSSNGSDSESDIEMHSRLEPQKPLKPPPSPKEHLEQEAKKIPIKDMVHAALKELNTRKGVSLYAIKKYMVETYKADTLKINFYIKKYIKNGVEAGTIVQTKGVGASGSFKLAPVNKSDSKPKKKKIVKSDKPKKDKSEKSKNAADPDKVKTKEKTTKKVDEEGKMIKTTKTKPSANKTKEKVAKEKGKELKKPKMKVAKESKKETVKEPKKKVGKMKLLKGSGNQSPVKKAPMIRRKSIGSIIKPPKMKPKMRD